MSKRGSEEAKAKERETRKALGPRLPRSPSAPLRVTAEPRKPRATGSTAAAMSDTDGKANGSS